MPFNSIMQQRMVHMVILIAFIIITLFEQAREVLPMWEYILAFGFLIVWMLGQRYEREILIDAGLAERDEVIEVERNRATLLWRN